jgi:CRP/FNR family transcriptional regulator
MPLIDQIPIKNEFFSSLDETSLALLKRSLIDKKILAGEVVIWEGDVSQEMYIVKSGWLKVVKSSEKGREMILHLLRPGDIFNALAAFIRFDNPATVIALDDSVLQSLSYGSMASLLEQHPQFARQLLEKFAGRLQKMTELIGDLSLRSVETRLAELLINNAVDNVFVRQKWLTQSEMAALIGTVPDVFNRVLNHFVEKGYIELNRGQIKIINRSGIEEKAGHAE